MNLSWIEISASNFRLTRRRSIFYIERMLTTYAQLHTLSLLADSLLAAALLRVAR